MILKSTDIGNHGIKMELNIDYTEEVITVEVTEWDRRKHESITKSFPAEDFPSALMYYEVLENRLQNQENNPYRTK